MLFHWPSASPRALLRIVPTLCVTASASGFRERSRIAPLNRAPCSSGLMAPASGAAVRQGQDGGRAHATRRASASSTRAFGGSAAGAAVRLSRASAIQGCMGSLGSTRGHAECVAVPSASGRGGTADPVAKRARTSRLSFLSANGVSDDQPIVVTPARQRAVRSTPGRIHTIGPEIISPSTVNRRRRPATAPRELPRPVYPAGFSRSRSICPRQVLGCHG